MEKLVKLDGKEVRMVANGGTPRLYRAMFKRDVFKDMNYSVNDEGEIENAEVFENLAFVMAKQGGLEGYDIDAWLATMENPTAIIEAVPDILELWTDTNETAVDSKKK